MPIWRLRRGAEGEAADALLEQARAAADDDDPEGALRLARRALRMAERSADEDDVVDALLLVAGSLEELDDLRSALPAAERAVRLRPEQADVRFVLATVQYRLGDVVQAAENALHVTAAEPRDAYAWHLRARALQWSDLAAADAAFARAADLEPAFVVPCRLDEARFDELADNAWATLPSELRSRVTNTFVTVQLLPDVDELRDGLDPDTLGIYQGPTIFEDDSIPARIVVFQRNLENICPDLHTLAEEVRRTLVHEVGHHLGLDHDELPF